MLTSYFPNVLAELIENTTVIINNATLFGMTDPGTKLVVKDKIFVTQKGQLYQQDILGNGLLTQLRPLNIYGITQLSSTVYCVYLLNIRGQVLKADIRLTDDYKSTDFEIIDIDDIIKISANRFDIKLLTNTGKIYIYAMNEASVIPITEPILKISTDATDYSFTLLTATRIVNCYLYRGNSIKLKETDIVIDIRNTGDFLYCFCIPIGLAEIFIGTVKPAVNSWKVKGTNPPAFSTYPNSQIYQVVETRTSGVVTKRDYEATEVYGIVVNLNDKIVIFNKNGQISLTDTVCVKELAHDQ